jgi:Flp pilus assembly protein TadG
MRNRLIKSQRGQALILIALAFLGMAAFVGLTVDAGILFANIGHLRKAVDAAALAASTEYRADVTEEELMATVKEYLALNDIDPDAPNITIGVCNLVDYDPDWSGYHDPTLCKENNPWNYDRKIVRVNAELPVNLAFLPVIGIRTVTIKAEAWSEAASVDLVLVLDTSDSMAQTSKDEGTWPACNDDNSCYPFEYVRQAAKEFVDKMYYPYDRVAIVKFDAQPEVVYPLTSNSDDLQAALDNMKIQPPLGGCPTAPDVGGCVNTDLADGLITAGDQFALPAPDGGRSESLWVVVVLTDGAANQAQDTRDPRPDPDPSPLAPNWLCPNAINDPPGNHEPTWTDHRDVDPDAWGPYCRDGRVETRHDWTDFWYDVEDAAKDAADRLGCYQNDNPARSSHCSTWDGDQGYGGPGIDDGFEAQIFTIGMGPALLDSNCDFIYYDDSDPEHECEPDMGAGLLRYIAAVGDDGNPDTDLCAGLASDVDCGNYYYREQATELGAVFDDIAKRIFTRLTH